MYHAKIQNAMRELLEITNNPLYIVESIIGLNPTNANINTNSNANFDGTTYNSSKLNERNIVITLLPRGNVEQSRIELYKYVKVKQFIRFYFANSSRNVYIDGYVESFECDFFENPQKAQISIICPQPYFNAMHADTYELSFVQNGFTFPFCTNKGKTFVFGNYSEYAKIQVLNDSDVAIGALITFIMQGDVSNPVIFKENTGEYIKISGDYVRGDVITINTIDGKKSITLTRDGKTTSLLNNMLFGSSWFKIEPVRNVFYLDASVGADDLLCTITATMQYEGV